MYINVFESMIKQYQVYFDEVTRYLGYNTGLMMINHNLDPTNIPRT